MNITHNFNETTDNNFYEINFLARKIGCKTDIRQNLMQNFKQGTETKTKKIGRHHLQ